jgi:hypothetical protein
VSAHFQSLVSFGQLGACSFPEPLFLLASLVAAHFQSLCFFWPALCLLISRAFWLAQSLFGFTT